MRLRTSHITHTRRNSTYNPKLPARDHSHQHELLDSVRRTRRLSLASVSRCLNSSRLVALALLLCLSAIPIAGQSPPSVADDIRVYVSVMDPQTVADVFGKRIAQRFVAVQVTIRNRNRDHQFLLHDVSLDLENVFPPGYFAQLINTQLDKCEERVKECQEKNKTRTVKRDCGQCIDPCEARRLECEKENENRELKRDCGRCSGFKYELSSLELSLLRGVAEKGQSENGRNKILRLLEGVGTVAAGLIGIAGFGDSYGDSVALFNGPVLAAYRHGFPDYTINQMNRLSDSAYQSNALIPRTQAKVIVGFITQRLFLSKEQRNQFWKEPTLLLNGDNAIDFRRTEVLVRGSFIEELDNLPLLLNSIQFDQAELKNFQNDKPSVKGYITGRFSQDARINILNHEPQGLSIKLDGTPSSNRLNFIIESDKPVPPDTLIILEVADDQTVQTITRPVHYVPDLPTVTAINVESGEVGSNNLEVEITGTNFIPGKTRIRVSGTGVEIPDSSVKVLGSTSLRARVNIDENAATAERELTVVNPAGESQESITFTVTPKR